MSIIPKFSLFLLLLCFCSCENVTQTKPAQLALIMKRDTFTGPCRYNTLTIETNGKVVFINECSSSDSSTINREFESQLSDEKVKEIISEIKKVNFFSFESDYSFNSDNCSTAATDSPSVILKIKLNESEKTINHYYGCWVNSWFSDENALQPLSDLESKIDEIVGQTAGFKKKNRKDD